MDRQPVSGVVDGLRPDQVTPPVQLGLGVAQRLGQLAAQLLGELGNDPIQLSPRDNTRHQAPIECLLGRNRLAEQDHLARTPVANCQRTKPRRSTADMAKSSGKSSHARGLCLALSRRFTPCATPRFPTLSPRPVTGRRFGNGRPFGCRCRFSRLRCRRSGNRRCGCRRAAGNSHRTKESAEPLTLLGCKRRIIRNRNLRHRRRRRRGLRHSGSGRLGCWYRGFCGGRRSFLRLLLRLNF